MQEHERQKSHCLTEFAYIVDLFQETFPNFSIVSDDFFGDISLPSAEDAPCDPESRKTETSEVNIATTPKATDEVDASRFPVVSSDEIKELKSVAVNKNTSRSTKQLGKVPPS